MARVKDSAKQREWRERLRRFSKGNWTVAEFCRREGVSSPSFYQWSRRLRGAKRVKPASRKEAFVPVRIAAPLSVELRLPNGATFSLPAGDAGLLATAIEAAARIPVAGAEDQPC